MFAGAGHLPAE